jgi:glutaredoxin
MSINLYSKEACVPCAKIKLWFKNKQINYNEYSLNDHIEKLITLGFMSAPVVEIDGKYFNGANISSVAEYIDGRI